MAGAGLLAVVLVSGLAFWPTLANEFPYDDAHVAQAHHPQRGANPMIAELQTVASYFTTEYWTGTGTGTEQLQSNPLYRPVTVYSIALTHALWPGDGSPRGEAFPHHLVNLLLQLLNTVLVFALARRCAAGTTAALAAAAVFGTAAIHAEPVASIVGRADLLAFGFGLDALLSWFGQRDPTSPRPTLARILRIGGASLLLFLAFCSKESALAWWPFGGCLGIALAMHAGTPRPWSGAWRPLLLGVLPSLAWWYLRHQTLSPLSTAELVSYVANPLQYVPLGQRILAGLAIQGYAITSIFAPLQLASDYGAAVFPFAEPDRSFGLLPACYLALWLGFCGLGLHAAWRRRPLPFLLATTLVGFGIITSNVLLVIGTIHAERLLYLPSLGAAWAAAWLLQRRSRWLPIGLVCLWCLANSAQTFRRSREWRDSATLFCTDAERQPDSLVLRLQAAAVYQQRGDWQNWFRHLEAARQLRPQWARAMIELAAGQTLLAQHQAPSQEPARASFLAKRLQAAEQLLRRAAQAEISHPDDDKRLAINLGTVQIQLGQAQQALQTFRTVIDANPDDVQLLHSVLINAASGLADTAFLAILTRGESRHADAPLLRMHRGLRAARQARWPAARDHLEAAMPRIEIRDTQIYRAWLVLAGVRQRAGDQPAGRRLYHRIAANPEFPSEIRSQAAEAGK